MKIFLYLIFVSSSELFLSIHIKMTFPMFPKSCTVFSMSGLSAHLFTFNLPLQFNEEVPLFFFLSLGTSLLEVKIHPLFDIVRFVDFKFPLSVGTIFMDWFSSRQFINSSRCSCYWVVTSLFFSFVFYNKTHCQFWFAIGLFLQQT